SSIIPLGVGAASATSDTITGVVYRDLDDDGVHDAGEPTLPGVVFRSGSHTAISDASGIYVLSGISGTVNVRADAGWFRSQCRSAYSGPSSGSTYTTSCPDPGAGAGADQDFRVDNQLLSATASAGGTASLGLTPDWVGTGYGSYTTDPMASMTKDPAMRLSPGYRMPGADADCQNFVCRPNETQWVLTQWLNQGTRPLRQVRNVLVAPAGSSITQVTPYTGHGPGSGHTITGFSLVDPATTARIAIGADGRLSSPESRVDVKLHGRLLPGSEYLLAVAFTMDANAPFSDGNHDGVPDCSADTGAANPGQTCTLATDSSPGSYIAWGAVTHIRGGGDADAVFCPNIPNDCPALGVHNKTQPGDSNDSGAWKVDSNFPPA
ncbi:MAG: hypothetical protein ACJ73L_07280, partial [Actinomycetes bacterium]